MISVDQPAHELHLRVVCRVLFVADLRIQIFKGCFDLRIFVVADLALLPFPLWDLRWSELDLVDLTHPIRETT